ARMALTRQIAYVALMTADGAVEQTWTAAEKNLHTLRDIVEAVPILPDAKLRAATYPKVKALLHRLPPHLADQVKGGKGTFGRYVRIELPGNKKTLTLAEVQILSGGMNIAPQAKAKQSSTAFGGDARRAIDGNTSGVYGDGGQTHTKENE